MSRQGGIIGAKAAGGGFAPESTKYLTICDDPGTGTSYVGQAAFGSATSAAVWRISRMTDSGSLTTIEYADGDVSFDNIWDNRAALSYS